jgi:RNA polymerase sigma-70 factor (ECF subfamily)
VSHGRREPAGAERKLPGGRAPAGPHAAGGGFTVSIGEVIEKQRAYLLRVASREIGARLRVKVDPSDVVQQTCLEALRDSGRLQAVTEAEVRAWLRSILLNNIRGLIRKCRLSAVGGPYREVSLEGLTLDLGDPAGPAADPVTPSGQVIAEEEARRVRDALERLPGRERELILARVEGDRTFRQIGEGLGCSAVAARKTWLRALARLRRELRASHAE